MEGLLEGPHGMVVAVCVAIAAAALLFGFQRLKVAEHKWAADMAGKLSAMGLSASVTTPLTDLATGDLPGAIGAGIHAAEYLKTPANVGTEVVNVLQKALADPVQKPLILKLVADIAGGATPDQIKADLKAEFDANPASQLTLGPIATQIEHAAASIHAIAASPALAGPLAILHSLNLGNLTGPIAALLGAGAAVAKANPAPATGTTTDPTTGATPAPSFVVGALPPDHSMEIKGPTTSAAS